MQEPALRIFSYLPNPRVWKALIAAEFCGARVEVCGDAPPALATWLWDFDARPLEEGERSEASPYARTSKRGFSGTLYKTDAFLAAHPFGTVPAAFSPDGAVGVFESNSIMRAVARAGAAESGLYGGDGYQASRIDSFLDASLVFAREAQVYLLALRPREVTPELHERMSSAYEFYLDGVERALGTTSYLAGETVSLADIAFVCDLAQFLKERGARESLRGSGLAPVSEAEPKVHPRAFEHLFRLADTPEFSKHLAGYLDDAGLTAAPSAHPEGGC